MVDNIKAMLSNPLDASTKDEMQNLIKTVLGTFTKIYVKKYALGLVKKVLDDASEAPEPEWKLMERPPRTDAFMEGWVMKEGGFFTKSMNKRYFVVRPNYMIDYYATEEEAKKENGKKKGTISLCGYYVNDDANNGPYQRILKLAEKFGVDTSVLPKPKQYPANTMELYHSRRETYYINIADNDEFKKWLEQMKTCAWRAYGYKNKDPVHVAAFDAAIQETRWEIGRWGWWSWGGTEEQVLSDLISDEIEYTVMGKVYSKIQGPWAVRNLLQEKVHKVVDKLVLAAVTPAWKAMSTTVEEVRVKLEPKIKETIGPIGEAKLQVIEKIKGACMSIIEPAVKEHVVPHIAKIMTAIQSPMVEAFDESFTLFDTEVIGKFNVKENADENKKEFRHLDYFPWSWKFWDVTRKVDVMYDPLWALNIVFTDIYPWSLIWDARDTLRSKMDNAIYTFEEKLISEISPDVEDVEGKDKSKVEPAAAVGKVKDLVIADYKVDARQAITLYYTDIIKKIVMPPLSKIINPPADAALSPLQDAIPEPMQDFLDLKDMFNRIVEGVIDDTIKIALESA